MHFKTFKPVMQEWMREIVDILYLYSSFLYSFSIF